MPGARLEREGLMEWRHVVVSAAQNVAANGYGSKDVDAGVHTDQCSHSLNACACTAAFSLPTFFSPPSTLVDAL